MKDVKIIAVLILMLSTQALSAQESEKFYYSKTLESSFEEVTDKIKSLLKEQGFCFDMTYTSVLKRAMRTHWLLLDEMNLLHAPVERSWRLNERHYGALTGLNKAETAEKYGADKVQLWRRSFDVPPQPLECDDERNPKDPVRYWSSGS